MFTGLIENLCAVKSVQYTGRAMRLCIELGNLAEGVKQGDSIAVSGVCLTVAKLSGRIAEFDVSPETLEKTSLGRLSSASKVNIERAMRADARFGGHFVQGHVDGTARVELVRRNADFADVSFSAGSELLGQMVVKGSVAVDGISLTIVELNENSFCVSLIPQTLKQTTLGFIKAGDIVNIETDIIVRVVKKQFEKILPQHEGLTIEKLQKLGF